MGGLPAGFLNGPGRAGPGRAPAPAAALPGAPATWEHGGDGARPTAPWKDCQCRVREFFVSRTDKGGR